MRAFRSHVFRFFVAFILITLVLASFIVAVSMIPQKQIKGNMLESAEYMAERNVVFRIQDFVRASSIDRYANCLTLSIAWELDEKNPLKSAMKAGYYGNASDYINDYFLEAVENDLPADQEYIRYWHGSAALMRVAHLFWNVRQVYIFHAVFLAGLFIYLLVFLIKRRLGEEAIAFLLSMIAVSVWYVPLCLEYTYSFLCMLVGIVLSVHLSLRKQYERMGIFFMVVGMVTVYFDFLTSETLSLLIPLLFVIRIRNRQEVGNTSGNRSLSIHCCIAWGIGYLGMWVMKWILASIVLRENVLPYVMGHISERLDGNISGLTGWNYIIQAILSNLKCLFPYEYGISGAVLVVVFVAVAFFLPVAIGRIRLKGNTSLASIGLYLVLGIIPYIRYAVLHNHAYIHASFTHRAQAASILALSFIILELVEPVQPIHRKAVNPHGSDNPHALPE